MPTSSRADLTRNRTWIRGVAWQLGLVLFALFPGILELLRIWFTKADYSHGVLLAPFAGYLLWLRREMQPAQVTWPSLAGIPFILLAIGLHFFGDYNYAREGVRGLSVYLGLASVAFTFCGGWAVWRWIWPSFGFLLFALPLPSTFEHEFSWYLQSVAVKASTFLFQLLGFAAYQPPNQMLVVLGSTRLEVERTCAGLSMLLTFVSLAGAIAFLIPNRVRVDRILILASAVPIAVICNIGRIVITGLVYHAGWTWLGDLIVHELAGWLMMPAALGLIWLELRFIDWILIPQDDASLDEVARASRRAPLFLMPQPEGRSRAEFPPPSLTPPPVASIEVDRLPQPRSGVGS